jgi:hypothetical protein
VNAQYLPTIALGIALVVFIIYRQLARRPVEIRPMVVLPLILAVLGLYNLNKEPLTSGAGVGALVASLATAVVFGLARGYTTRVWLDSGTVTRQGTAITLALWIIAILLRIGIGAIARHAGVPQSVTFGELPLFLGVTLAAQNLVIWMRAQALGMTPGIQSGRVR